MSFTRIMAKLCNQIAVYWGSPKPYYGTATYDPPVEIYCNWSKRTEVVTDADGKEITSKAQVYTLQDLDEEGFLYLGTLNDLDSDEQDNPMKIEGAFSIKRFNKSRSMKNKNIYVRKAYL